MENREAALIPDASVDDRWLQRPDDTQSETGSKSVISVPFLARGQVVGVITLVHYQTDFFKENQRSLIQAIADQSAIAVLNARFHTDTLHQARVMTALAESAAAITGSLNLEDVLQRILEQISQAFNSNAVSLALIDKDKKSLSYCASTLGDEYNPVGMCLDFGEGVAGWVAENCEGVIIANPYDDSRFSPSFDQKTGYQTEAIACVPIFSEGEIIGTLETLNPETGSFERDALRVLQGISSIAGSAILHAQLFEALQEAHRRYYDLFEGSFGCILLTDQSGKIIEANQRTVQLSGISKDALYGTPIDKLHIVDLETLGENYQLIPKERMLSYESTLQTMDGASVPIITNVQQVSVEGKEYFQWFFSDITERKELEKLQEDLLSMIYHDLRSPLANVVSSLDMISTMVNFDDEYPNIQSLFTIAMRSTKRIQRLTASLLDINRLEAGQPVISKSLTKIESVFGDALEELQPIFENKKIKISLEIAEPLPKLLINEEMVQRVVINLLENAIKYTPKLGSIHLGAQIKDQNIQVWVQDTGPGITEEFLPRIFDKYTRLHRKGKRQGYGLGLAFCRLAVTSHGGSIWAENIPNVGSRFTFTLPMITQAERLSEASPSKG
jgi:PAS domain S-box-containing protein